MSTQYIGEITNNDTTVYNTCVNAYYTFLCFIQHVGDVSLGFNK